MSLESRQDVRRNPPELRPVPTGLAEVTAPLPYEHTPSAKPASRRLAKLARKWAYLVSGTAYLPYQPQAIERVLAALVQRLFEAVRAGALAKAVERTPAALAELTLYDLVHVEDRDSVRQAYQDLLDGGMPRVRLGRRLVGPGGEPVWATFSVAVVRDAAGEAQQLITIVDDDTEV